MNPTLSESEIQDITGFNQVAKQKEWFEQNGIPCFEKGGKGGLTVARAWFDQAPLQKATVSIDMPRLGSAPDFGKIGRPNKAG